MSEGTINDGSESLRQYLREIGRFPLLTKEQEMILTQRVADGDLQSRNRLMEANLRLVVHIASRYKHLGVDLLDLIGEGNLGLYHATQKFDPARGFRFTTYATWWIRQAIMRAVDEYSHTIHIPVHVVEQIHTIKRAHKHFLQDHGREPTASELAPLTGQTVRKVQELWDLDVHTVSLDEQIGSEDDDDGAFCRGEILEDKRRPVDPENCADQMMLKQQIDDALAELDPRERALISIRYGLHDGAPLTRDEASTHFNVGRERIRQIEVKALKKMSWLMESGDA